MINIQLNRLSHFKFLTDYRIAVLILWLSTDSVLLNIAGASYQASIDSGTVAQNTMTIGSHARVIVSSTSKKREEALLTKLKEMNGQITTSDLEPEGVLTYRRQ